MGLISGTDFWYAQNGVWKRSGQADYLAGSATPTISLTNSAEGGSNGSAVSTGNSGNTSGDAWASVSGTSAWTFSSTRAARGSLAYRCVQNVSEAATLTWDIATLGNYYGRAYLYFSGFAGGAQTIIRGWRDTAHTQQAWRIDILANGTVRLYDAAGTSLYLSADSLTAGIWYRFEWQIVSGLTHGSAEFKIFATDQTTAFIAYSNTNCNTANTAHISFGPGTTATQLPALYMDSIAIGTGAWLGVASGTALNALPVANAGADQTALPSGTVTLQGGSSVDSDGTIASYSWSQLSGTAVTLSGASTATPSFTAPAGSGTLVFQLIVTDNQGATGTDTVSVVVITTPLFRNTAEGGSNSTAVSTGNSGGTSGSAFAAVTGGTGVWTFSTDHTIRGALAYKCAPSAATPAALQWNPSALTEQYGRMYFYLTGFASAAEPLIKALSSGSVNAWSIELNAVGKLVVRDAGATAIHTAGTAAKTSVWYRLEWHVVSSGTVGQIEIRLYNGDQTTLIDTFTSGVNVNTGPEVSILQFGPSQSVTPAASASYYDELAVGSAAGGWLGIAPGTPPSQAPVANAGPDDVTPAGSSYLLNGSGSDDGSIVSYQWVWLSGLFGALSDPSSSSPSFNAPNTLGGGTMTYGLTVVDNQGLSSAQDTVTITVPTPTLYMAKSGSWTPQP